jgi:hypothetical protein
MPVGDQQPRSPQATALEVTEHGRPALGGLAIAALDRQHHLAPVPQRGDQHEHRRLVLLQPGLDVDPVRPQVHRLEIVQPPASPRVVFGLPAGLQPRHRGGRQRRARAEQPAERQLEVALGQAMQVQLRQEPADFLGAPLE